MLKVRITDTYLVDFDEVCSLVRIKVSRAEARKAVRSEVQFLIGEACARVMDVPNLTERYLADDLVREDLAEHVVHDDA